MPNLPPVGSVWLYEDDALLRITQVTDYWIECESPKWRTAQRITLELWREWELTARCLYDPTTPQPDHAAECERLKAKVTAAEALIAHADEVINVTVQTFNELLRETRAWLQAVSEIPTMRFAHTGDPMESLPNEIARRVHEIISTPPQEQTK